MYLSEYLDRKETAENVLEPRYIEKDLTLNGAMTFLREQKGLPYPDSWFYSNPERTFSMYKKAYIQYWKQFLIEFKEWDSAKSELKYLEAIYAQHLIIDDLETTQSEYAQTYY